MIKEKEYMELIEEREKFLEEHKEHRVVRWIRPDEVIYYCLDCEKQFVE